MVKTAFDFNEPKDSSENDKAAQNGRTPKLLTLKIQPWRLDEDDEKILIETGAKINKLKEIIVDGYATQIVGHEASPYGCVVMEFSVTDITNVVDISNEERRENDKKNNKVEVWSVPKKNKNGHGTYSNNSKAQHVGEGRRVKIGGVRRTTGSADDQEDEDEDGDS
ncbi:hypothetical protein Tco_1318568 [Tanacetum coccineum]